MLSEEDVRWCPACRVRMLEEPEEICGRCDGRTAEEAAQGIAELEDFLAGFD